ncbi:MAG: T9SS type A sorting domain-containing protein [Saprospiraceae bacterium]
MKQFYLNYTFAFILSLCFLGANAQITIGSGTNEGQRMPIEAFYGYTYSQSIYLQSEIGASGNITTLSWYFSGTTALPNSQDLVIWIGHTTKTSFTGVTDYVDTTMMTRVYTGALGVPTGPGWITVTLDNAFNYNNTDNLVIAVDENTVGWDSSLDDFYCSSVTNDRSLVFFEDTNNPDPGVPSAGNQVTSAFIPNLILGGIQQACPATTALNTSNITTTSATLGWTENGTATTWNVEYGAAGFAQGSGTTVTGTMTNPYVITTGLMANTTYEFYVQADCGAGSTSLWTGPFSFTTPCAAYMPPYLEDFSNGAPPNACWNEADAGNATTGPTNFGGGQWLSKTFPNGTTAASINLYSDSRSDWLLSPDYDLTTGGPYQLEYDFGVFNYNSSTVGNMGSDDTVQVFISTDAGLTWTSLKMYDNTYVTPAGGAGELIDLTAYSGNTVRFAIWGSEGMVDDMEDVDVYVDNFWVRATPACIEPSALMASNITFTSADLSWTAGGTETSWEVEYDTTGFMPGTGTSIVTSANPYSISNLTASTSYDFYVRAICGPGDTSVWVSASFFTGYCTPAPTSVDGDGITNVTMGGVNNTTLAENGNYGDYTAQIATGSQGGVFPIDITVSTGIYDYDLWAWVDWNNDLDFTDAGEEYYLGASLGTLNGSITIPATAIGNYRIRIGGADTGLGSTPPANPCYTGSWAAFEDYTLNVINLPADDASITAAAAGNCSDMETVAVNITNFGTNTVTSVDVSYSVNGATPITETWTGSIATNEDSAYVFTTTFDASVPGNYEIKTWTSLPNDLVTTNDTITITVTSDTIYTTTFSQNFEGSPLVLTGWATDGDGGLTLGHDAPSIVFSDNLWSSDLSMTLISPKVSGINADDKLRLSYRYVDYATAAPYSAATLGTGDTLNVFISTDCGDNFTLIGQVHAGNHTPTMMMTPIEYDLSAYAGSTIRFAVFATWGTGDYFLDVDDFYIGAGLTDSVSTMNVNCFGEADGEATAMVAGGTAPYTYMWSNGATTATATGLGAGTYSYTAMDTMGYSVSDTVIITEPTALAISMSAVSDTNTQAVGSATAMVTGGTMPYTYTWNGTVGSSDLTALTAGTYTVEVTDANGCMATDSVVVEDAVSTYGIEYVTNVSIYPNPTRGNTVIDLELSQNADIAISVFSITGVLIQDFGKENTSHVTHQIDLSTYAEGMYLVRFVVDNQVITKKLLITK